MIGVCANCKATDALVVAMSTVGSVPDICEWCAEEQRREHDDAHGYGDEPGLHDDEPTDEVSP